MWFTSWKNDDMPIQIAIFTSVLAGVFFGLFMALYYKRSAKKNNLSDWNTL
jgi:preprotein translocase subunit SecG